MTATGQPSNATLQTGVTGSAADAAGQESRPDLHAAFRRITESLRVAWDADRVTLWLFQPDSHELALGAVTDADHPSLQPPLVARRPAAATYQRALATRRPAVLTVKDVQRVPGSALARIWQSEGYRVMVAVPLLRPDGPLGVAAASYRSERAFTSEQLATMQRAAALWTAEALTADLLPRVVQFAREQEVRARMSEAIEANAGHAVTTHILADAAMEGMGADRCSIWVYHSQLDAFEMLGQAGISNEEIDGQPNKVASEGLHRVYQEHPGPHVFTAPPDHSPMAQQLVLVMQGLGARQALCLPLLRRGECIGIMNWAFLSDEPVSPWQRALSQTMGELVTDYVVRAGLHTEQSTATRDEEVLARVRQVLVANQTAVDALREAAAITRDSLESVRVAVGVVDPYAPQLRLITAAGRELESPGGMQAVPTFNTMSGRVLETQQSMVLDRSIVQGSPVQFLRTILGTLGNGAVLVTPIVLEGRSIGLMYSNFSQVSYASPSARVLAERIAATIAPTVQVLEQQLQSDQRALERLALRRLSEAVVSAGSLPSIWQQIVSTVRDVVGADRVALWSWDQASERQGFLAVTGADDPSLRPALQDPRQAAPEVFEALRNRHTVVLDLNYITPGTNVSELAPRLGLRELAVVPVRHEDRTIGFLTIGYRRVGHLSDRVLELLETISNHVAAAIVTARARTEAAQRDREQLALHRISSAIVSGEDVEHVLQAIADASLEALAADRVTVFRYVAETQELQVGGAAGLGSGLYQIGQRLSANGTAALEALEQRRPRLLGAISGGSQPQTSAGRTLFDTMPVQALVVWPIIHEDTWLGALGASYCDPQHMDPLVMSLGETVANHAAVAIFSADLHDRTVQRARELEAINGIGRAVASGQSTEAVLREIADTTRQALGADRVTLWLYHGKDHFDLGALSASQPSSGARLLSPGPAVSGSTAERALEERRVIEIDEHNVQNDQALARLFAVADLTRMWVAPIYRDDLPLGVLSVGYKTPPPFAASLTQTTENIASQTAVALLGALLRSQTERHTRELEALQSISASAASDDPPKVIMQRVAAAAAEAANAARTELWVYDAAADSLFLTAIAGQAAQDRDEETPQWLPVDMTVAGSVLRSGEPAVVSEERRLEEVRPRVRRIFAEHGLKTVLLVQVGGPHDALGVLTLWFPRPMETNDPIVDVAKTIAAHAAIAVSRATALEDRRASEERLQLVSDNVADVAYSLAAKADGTFVTEWVNSAFQEMTGWDAHEGATVEHWMHMVHPEDFPPIQEHLHRLLSESRAEVVQYRIIDRRGELHWVEGRSRSVWSEEEQRVVRIYGVIRDRTEQHRTTEALHALERVAPATLDALSAHIVILDAAGRVVAVNRAWRTFNASGAQAGLTPAVVIGDDYLTLCGELAPQVAPEANSLPDGIRRVIAGDIEEFSLEYSVVAGPEPAWFSVRVTPLQGERGRSVVVAHENISDRKRAEDALMRQALFDALTGLPNRVLLFDRLQRALAEAPVNNHAPALLIMDLDRFKEVNDSFGHEMGDVVLGLVADRLRETVPQQHTVARLGGDEFAVLLSGHPGGGTPEAVAEAMVLALRPPFLVEGLVLDVQASVGVAKYPEHGTDVQSLMRRADVAMYVAKHSGTGYAVYTREQDRNQPRRMTLLAELRRAIDADELGLVYHPQVELATGEVQWVEALVRWVHPTMGLLMPDEFVPPAEQTGLIYQLTRWILRRTLRQAAAWQRQGLQIGIAVNFSARDLQLPGMPDFVTSCLRQYRVPASKLKVEITEGSLMDEPEQVLRTVTHLRSRGVGVVLDDFGMGYASLSHLKQLPIDELKIDRSFVSQLRQGGLDATIVRLTIELGHQMGARVVAEGVEDQETIDLLRQMGCDAAQGFYLSEPAPAERLRTWLADRARPTD